MSAHQDEAEATPREEVDSENPTDEFKADPPDEIVETAVSDYEQWMMFDGPLRWVLGRWGNRFEVVVFSADGESEGLWSGLADGAGARRDALTAFVDQGVWVMQNMGHFEFVCSPDAYETWRLSDTRGTTEAALLTSGIRWTGERLLAADR